MFSKLKTVSHFYFRLENELFIYLFRTCLGRTEKLGCSNKTEGTDFYRTCKCDTDYCNGFSGFNKTTEVTPTTSTPIESTFYTEIAFTDGLKQSTDDITNSSNVNRKTSIILFSLIVFSLFSII